MNLLYGLGSKLKDKKLKMVLLTAMYLILFSVVLLLIIFYDASQRQMNYIGKYIEREVSIMKKEKPLFEDTVHEILKADCIDEYNIMAMAGVRLRGSKPVIKDEDLYRTYLKETERKMTEVWKQEYKIENLPEVMLIETNCTENSSFFLNKGFQIVEGQGINADDMNEAVISAEFAKINNLHVGDYIETEHCADDYYYADKVDMNLRVKGIFDHADEIFQGKPSAYKSNYIFTSIGPISQSYTTTYERMTVYLKEGYSIADLKKEISEKSLYLDVDNYTFSSSNEWGEVISEPLKNMQTMSGLLLALMLVSILIIIFLLGSFYLKGNLHNIGVMLSMGIRKSKIVFQLLLEECAPLLLGALLSILIGFGSVGTVSQIIESQYTSELKNITAEKNKELLDNKVQVTDSISELRTIGQVMRMEGDFTAEYTMNWNSISIFFSIICIFLPGCVSVQILYKIRHYSIKKILLS